MDVDINYLAVFLAALSSMVVGSFWYSPKVFGNAWMKLARVTPDTKMSAGKMALMYGSVLIASLVTAYVLAHVTFLSFMVLENSWMNAALGSAFWLWLGFTAARMFTHDTFEERRKKLTLLNVSHELVTFLVMALIIGAMKV